jgi:hypothetical protein
LVSGAVGSAEQSAACGIRWPGFVFVRSVVLLPAGSLWSFGARRLLGPVSFCFLFLDGVAVAVSRRWISVILLLPRCGCAFFGVSVKRVRLVPEELRCSSSLQVLLASRRRRPQDLRLGGSSPAPWCAYVLVGRLKVTSSRPHSRPLFATRFRRLRRSAAAAARRRDLASRRCRQGFGSSGTRL